MTMAATRASEVLLGGGIIAYPTEGVFGLGCLPDDDDAVARIRTAGANMTGIKVHGWGGRFRAITDTSGNIFDLIDARQKGSI